MMTINELMELWLDSVKPRIAPNTYNGYKVNCNHISEFIGDMFVNDVKPYNVQMMYNKLAEQLSGTSCLYIHRCLSMIFDFAEMLEVTSSNPCKKVLSPRKSKFKGQSLTSSDLHKLLDSVKETHLYLPFVLASCLGLRRGEVIALRRSDIDFNSKILTVTHSGIVKNGKVILSSTKSVDSQRSLVLSDALVHLIDELGGDEYICPVTQTQLDRGLKRALKSCGLSETIRFHDLRHTHATLSLVKGVSVRVLSAKLGHSNPSVTLNVYSHAMIEMQKETATCFDEYVDKSPKI